MPALGEGLQKYCRQGHRSFHTPGHKGRQEFFHGMKFPDFDLTELPGLDQLSSASGIIAEAQQRAAVIFGAEESFFLVNGGTVGNQAMFLALGDTSVGKKVLVGRQSHRSVMSALVLTGLIPEYLTPIIHPEFNLPLGLEVGVEQITWESIIACHITYPSYYGTTFDLRKLINDRNKRGVTKPILVDQAHGSHYLGEIFPPSALSALTQASMLHVQGKNIRRERLYQSLEMLQSSSPSYLLMASLELAGEFALASERWEALHVEVENLHSKVGSILRVLNQGDVGTYGIEQVDWSKILVNIRVLGQSAQDCVNYLRKNHGIEPELWDEENILFVLGIGNTPEDIRELTMSLQSLANSTLGNRSRGLKTKEEASLRIYPKPVQRMTPREAFFARRRQISLTKSSGFIVAETISPYPPGIPLIVMGEEITPEIVEILLARIQGNWQGWDGVKSGMIWVVED